MVRLGFVEIAAGTLIGGYRVEAVIGSGSMGTVYSAEDTTLSRLCVEREAK